MTPIRAVLAKNSVCGYERLNGNRQNIGAAPTNAKMLERSSVTQGIRYGQSGFRQIQEIATTNAFCNIVVFLCGHPRLIFLSKTRYHYHLS